MGLSAILVGSDGEKCRSIPDPSGGTFDAAGDFDRLLPHFDDDAFQIWRQIDPHDTTVFGAAEMPSLLEELDRFAHLARPGPGRQGLARLRIMAIRCRDTDELLRFDSD